MHKGGCKIHAAEKRCGHGPRCTGTQHARVDGLWLPVIAVRRNRTRSIPAPAVEMVGGKVWLQPSGQLLPCTARRYMRCYRCVLGLPMSWRRSTSALIGTGTGAGASTSMAAHLRNLVSGGGRRLRSCSQLRRRPPACHAVESARAAQHRPARGITARISRRGAARSRPGSGR